MRYPLILVLALFVIAGAAIADDITREKFELALHPSAKLAYDDGMRHLDSLDRSHYNISAADYFFETAARLDPGYPYVHHQIARIDFIQGHYPEALAEVNKEIANDPGKTRAAAYYLRGIVEGYLNDYQDASRDYKQYVELNPVGWEGRTDYAWTLIKTGNLKDAMADVNEGLAQHPGNPWLLSVRATVLYEQGKLPEALAAARKAKIAVDGVTDDAWLKAYPGNDPMVAPTGVATLRAAAESNLEKIELEAAKKGIK